MDLDPQKVTDITPLSVERKGDVLIVTSELTMEDGSVVPGRLMLPVDTMEWRSAEYNIPPEDADTLLDIILYEPFLPEPDRPDLLLHDAVDIEEARAYHLDRIGKVKAKAKKAKGSGLDPVRERIKELSVFDSEAIGLKKQIVAKTRSQVEEDKKAKLRALVDPVLAEQTSRVAMLRARLIDRTTKKGNSNG